MASSFISAIAIFTGMGFIPSPKCPYALKAEVVEAIEGGPVVIRLQVRNIGYNPPKGILPFVDLASLQVAAPLSACELTTPKSWGPASTPAGLIDGYWDGYADLPKEGWESWLNLHQECEHISSGEYDLTLTWPIFKNRTKRIGQAATVIRINVLPATAENLSGLRHRLENRWLEASANAEKQNVVLDMLDQTSQRELVQTAMSFLRSPHLSSKARTYPLMGHIWRTAPDLTHETFTQIARDFKADTATSVFELWCHKPAALPESELRRICESPRLCVRMLTYAAFGQRCNSDWAKKLRQDVVALGKSTLSPSLAKLMADLDDARFSVRGQAKRELFEADDVTDTQVRAALMRPLSAEVQHSLQQYLERFKAGQSSALMQRAIEFLGAMPTPEALEILKQLVQGDSESYITYLAKKSLQKRLDFKIDKWRE